MYNREEELERVLQDLLECFGDGPEGFFIETKEGVGYIPEDTENIILRATNVLNEIEDTDE